MADIVSEYNQSNILTEETLSGVATIYATTHLRAQTNQPKIYCNIL